MSQEDPIPIPASARGSRLTWLWITSFGFLAFLGAFCYFAVWPYLEVRKVLKDPIRVGESLTPRVDMLGGPRDAVRKLSIYIALPKRLAWDKVSAIQCLGACGPEATASLLRLTKRHDPLERAAAFWALGAVRDPRATEPLLAEFALRTRTALLAAHVLGMIGDPRATEPLIAALSDPDASIRESAAWALGEMPSPKLIEPLLTAFRDADTKVRVSVARALGKSGYPTAFIMLMTMLDDRNASIRSRVIGALGDIGDERALPVLEDLSHKHDKDYPELQYDCEDAIRMIRQGTAARKN